MIYEEGDKVFIVSGQIQGHLGVVDGYDESFDRYVVLIPALGSLGFSVRADEMCPARVIDERAGDIAAFGMTSRDLAEYTTNFLQRCANRVRGAGDDQYSRGSFQNFEAMAFDNLLVMTLEEIEDWAVYAAMAHIRVRRVLQALKGRL